MQQSKTPKRNAVSLRVKHRHGEEPSIKSLLREQETIVRTGAYKFLGRVLELHTDKGVMRFLKSGPAVGRVAGDNGEDRLVILGEWHGLPDMPKPLEEPCPDCQIACDECENGTRACTLCGGEGKDKTLRVPCRCITRNRPKAKCRRCKGSGMALKGDPCRGCQGKKRVDCALCGGTGKMATGADLAGVETDARSTVEIQRQLKLAPSCKTCRGHRKAFAYEVQELKPFVRGQLEGHPVLGPIHKIVLHVEKFSASVQILNVAPDADGNYLALVLDKAEVGSKMYLLGGRVL